MIARRAMLGLGLAAGLAACAGPSLPPATSRPPRARATPGLVDEPALLGLDAIIDLHHASGVSSFASARQTGNVLAVIHKASEGDWRDPRYGQRRSLATQAGMLWGAYHFGTRQHSGRDQAAMFLEAARPDPATLLVLDLEPNPRQPDNTMDLDRAEEFARAIAGATGRLPLLYTHPRWADGEVLDGQWLGGAIATGSLLASCELWLADYRAEPELPQAWSRRGWRMWQYAGDDALGGPFRERTRQVPGIERCDRSVFAGGYEQLLRWWPTVPS